MDDEFYQAAILGDFKKVRQIIKNNPEYINLQDEYGFTVLHGLAEEENYEILQFLIDYGTDVNIKNKEGITPLHLSAYPEIVRILLKNGADLEAKSNIGDTPLISLSSEKYREAVIEALLEAGANVHAKNNYGETALDIVCSRNETEKINLLKKYGAK